MMFWKRNNDEFPTALGNGLWIGGEYEVQMWFAKKKDQVPIHLWIDLREELEWNRKIEAPPHIISLKLPLQDGDTHAGNYLVPAAVQIVQKALDRGKHVLVSCHEGKSRSAAIILGLWAMQEGGLETATNRLRALRPQCDVHPDLLTWIMDEYGHSSEC